MAGDLLSLPAALLYDLGMLAVPRLSFCQQLNARGSVHSAFGKRVFTFSPSNIKLHEQESCQIESIKVITLLTPSDPCNAEVSELSPYSLLVDGSGEPVVASIIPLASGKAL
jgi:hypothetical protein